MVPHRRQLPSSRKFGSWPVVTPAEDRGKEKSVAEAADTSDESAFGHVEGAAAERAASKRGHESAGEPVSGSEPRSGG